MVVGSNPTLPTITNKKSWKVTYHWMTFSLLKVPMKPSNAPRRKRTQKSFGTPFGSRIRYLASMRTQTWVNLY